jgi:hypothetical protein
VLKQEEVGVGSIDFYGKQIGKLNTNFITMEDKAYQQIVKYSGVGLYVVSLIYALEYVSYGYGASKKRLNVVEDTNNLLFAVVLSVIGTGLILFASSMNIKD